MTEHLVSLRPFEAGDLDTYRRWVNDPAIGDCIDRVRPVTAEEHRDWYSALLRNERAVVFAVDDPVGRSSSKYLGNVWLWDIDWRHRKAEVRILIGRDSCTGSGYGTAAIRQVNDFAFGKLNLHRLYAYVLAHNTRAQRAFEKAGYCTEGVLREDRFMNGSFVDTLVMARLRNAR